MLKKNYAIEDIVNGCRQRKPWAQKALLSEYADLLYGVSLRYVKDKHLAQEVVQDTFIKVFASIDNYKEEKGRIDSWMRTIAIRFALKYINKKAIKLSLIDEDVKDYFQLPADAIAKLQNDDLLELIRTLPEGYRQVFNLYVIEGYSHKEIADMMEIKEVSSRSNLSRAKEILRQKLLKVKPFETWQKVY